MEELKPACLLYQFRMMIVEEMLCPDCLGRLDDDLVCTRCEYDAWEEFENGRSE